MKKPPENSSNKDGTTAKILGAASPPDPPSQWASQARLLKRLSSQLRKDRSAHLAQAAEPLEPHSMHLADSGTDEFDHELALANVSSGQDVLFEIEEALKRIGNGTYGVCEATGEPIDPERLRAIPWARYTTEAEARLESKGLAGWAPHLGKLGTVRRTPMR